MGSCFSEPVSAGGGAPAGGGSARGGAPAKGPQANGATGWGGTPRAGADRPPSDLDRAGSGRPGSFFLRQSSYDQAQQHLQLLGDAHGLQQRLALVTDNPLLGLQEAAELLIEHLGVDLAAIWVVVRDDPKTSVLIAAHGSGTTALQGQIVARHNGAAPMGNGKLPCLGAPLSFFVPDAAASQSAQVPEALWNGPAALRSFVSIPVGDAAAPRGVMLVASRQTTPFDSSSWKLRLQAAATGLLPQLRHAQVEQMADLLRVMYDTEDPVALISVLLRSAARYMYKACGMRASVRIALLQPEDTSAALLFEAPYGNCSNTSPRSGAPPTSLVSCADAGADVVASTLALDNTLLGAALAQQQARFVADCGMYMQNSVRPARDIFTGVSDLVAAIVVVPLIPGGAAAPLGGLYVAVSTPWDFANSADTLLGFIHGVTPLLNARLAGQVAALAVRTVEEAITPEPQVPPLLLGASGSSPASRSGPPSRVDAANGALANGNSGVIAGGAGRGPSSVGGQESSFESGASPLPSERVQPQSSAKSGRLTKLGSRLNTDAMLQVLQQDIRAKSRRTSLTNGHDIVVGECLGRGGFGVVFKAMWHKVVVAAKVMPARNSEREAMQDAVEMAVLSSVQHPNIVSVFACLTDMVEISETGRSGSTGGVTSAGVSNGLGPGLRTRYRRLLPGESPPDGASTFNIVAMEYCDRGTLRDAVKGGMLHRQLPGGAIGVDLGAALEVLLDVAYAMQYLHSMGLVHGDIKLENILLKSDASRALGVTPKLSDFGLSKLLAEGDTAVNLDGAGTVTHLAPEMFVAGTKVTAAIDAYAFGVMAWETYTSKRAYAGLHREAVIERVYRHGMRPRFPSAAPAPFVALCEACWQTDPTKRPSFAEIAESLEALAARLAGQQQPPPSQLAPAPHAAPPAAAAAAAQPRDVPPGMAAGAGVGANPPVMRLMGRAPEHV